MNSWRGSRGNVSLSKPILGRRKFDALQVVTRGKLHQGTESGTAYGGVRLGQYRTFAQKRAQMGGGAINLGNFSKGMGMGPGRWFA